MKTKRFLLILVIFTLIFSPRCVKNKVVPDELIGVWKTTDPKYAAPCFLELTKDKIVFGSIEGTVEGYAIKDITQEKVKTEASVLYTISYLDSNKLKYELPIYYYPLEAGVIRLKNQQQIVWTKEQR